MFSKDTIYVLGMAKIGSNDPIHSLFDSFFIGLVIDRTSGKIVDSTCNMVREMTTEFIKSIVVGYRLDEEINDIIEEVNDRFHGLAQKAVIASLKDARSKYVLIKSNQK